MKNYFSAPFIAGVITGALLVGVWFVGPESSSRLSAPVLSTASRTEITTTSGAVEVHNQRAGEEVLVDSVTVSPPGVWVAVRERVGGELGNVLGALRVGAPRSNILVPLLRVTEPSRPYAVQLYRDDNDGEFDPARNSVYVDYVTGERVVASFTTTN